MSTINNNANNLQYASEQQWQAVLTFTDINGTSWTVTYDNFSGGDAAANVSKYRPSGMGDEVIVAALPIYSEITLTKGFNNHNDQNNKYGGDYNLQEAIRVSAGQVAGSVTITPLTPTGVAWGTPRVYYGVISEESDGNTGSESGSVRMWNTKFTVSGIAN